MDLIKYKILLDLPATVNELRKKHKENYLTIRYTLIQLQDQNLISMEKDKKSNNKIARLTDMGNKVCGLLTEVYILMQNDQSTNN